MLRSKEGNKHPHQSRKAALDVVENENKKNKNKIIFHKNNKRKSPTFELLYDISKEKRTRIGLVRTGSNRIEAS